jgi:hypothetical protein
VLLFHKLTERAAMLCRDRVETTRVAVALVAREGELASSDGEPSPGVLLNVNDESDRTRITGSRSCGLHVFELRFEPSAEEADRATDGALIVHRDRASGHQRRVSRLRRRS